MWTSARRFTPAVCAMRAAPRVPHWPGASPSASMISWSSQHMQSMRSASLASSVSGVAGLSVASEDDAARGGVEAICEGVKEGLNMLGGGCGDLPVAAGEDGAGAYIGCEHMRGFAWEVAASVLVDALAERMADARLPVVGEDAFVLVEDAVRDALGERGAEDLKGVLLAGALVPAAEEEAGVVYVVVEVVMSEEEVVDVGGPEASLDELVGGGGAAVHHHLLVADLEGERGAEAGWRGCGCARAEDVDCGWLGGHGFCPFGNAIQSHNVVLPDCESRAALSEIQESTEYTLSLL